MSHMGAQAKIAAFVRWVLTWPVLVVLALNIENATSDAGYGTLINRHWKDAFPALKGLYSFATSGWILYPALILFGAVLYEWIGHISNRMEKDGSAYQLWLVVSNAEPLASAFLKDGFNRRIIKPERDVLQFNKRLGKLGLPPVPRDFANEDQINQIYGSYLLLISKRQFDHARQFLNGANRDSSSAPNLPEGA